jgi:broad specificity phosphatase PhoE
MNFLMLRHAETQWNRDGLIQGRTDVELDSQSVQNLGRLLDSESPETFMVFSSPLQRCIQTSRILFPDVNPTVERALIERNYGVLEGASFSDDAKLAKGDFKPHGDRTWKWGPVGGESNIQVLQRVLAFVRLLKDDCILITHTGPIQVMIAHALRSQTSFPPVKHCIFYCFQMDSRKVIHYVGERQPLMRL